MNTSEIGLISQHAIVQQSSVAVGGKKPKTLVHGQYVNSSAILEGSEIWSTLKILYPD